MKNEAYTNPENGWPDLIHPHPNFRSQIWHFSNACHIFPIFFHWQRPVNGAFCPSGVRKIYTDVWVKRRTVSLLFVQLPEITSGSSKCLQGNTVCAKTSWPPHFPKLRNLWINQTASVQWIDQPDCLFQYANLYRWGKTSLHSATYFHLLGHSRKCISSDQGLMRWLPPPSLPSPLTCSHAHMHTRTHTRTYTNTFRLWLPHCLSFITLCSRETKKRPPNDEFPCNLSQLSSLCVIVSIVYPRHIFSLC